jgi:hypothetical protein
VLDIIEPRRQIMSITEQSAPSPSLPHHPGPEPASDETVPDRATLVVRPWWDPALATSGHDPRSEYVERFWLGVIGPSAVMLVRRLARGLAEHPGGFSIALPDTARAIGLGGGTGRSAPITRTIDRCCMFGLMRRRDDQSLDVRTHLPYLSRRQLERLPLAVRNSHSAWQAAQAASTAPQSAPLAPPTAA